MRPRPKEQGEPRELDEVTLARAQRGDAGACRALVGRYQRPVFALLSRLCGRARVEDLAQETILRVFQALPRFSVAGTARLSTWILTIATRLALDELRRKPQAQVALPADLPSDARADEAVERRALCARLERGLAQLSPEQRAVVLLREVHELEYEDIARTLELELGTVKSRLARARAALRAQLKDYAR